MTSNRESNLAVAVGGVLAVLVHLAVLPAVARSLQGSDPTHQPEQLLQELRKTDVPETPARPHPPHPKPPQEPKVPLGRDDAPDRHTVAWISHDDFEQLIAPKSHTEQPALQRDVTPTPQAPLIADPTPLALASKPSPPSPPATPPPSARSPSPEASSPVSPRLNPRTESTANPATEQPVDNQGRRPLAAHGPEPLPAPPVKQPHAEAETQVDALPIEQKESVTAREGDGVATRQAPTVTPQSLERGLAKTTTTDAPHPGEGRDRFVPAEADSHVDKPPTDQRRAETKTPAEKGAPTKLERAETPKPQPDGLPTELKAATHTEADEKVKPTQTQADQPKASPSLTEKVLTSLETAANRTAVQPNRPSPAQPPAELRRARPTSAAQADSEVDPVSLTSRTLPVRAGSVITGRGIQIKTVRPDISAVSRMTAVLRKPPLAKIIFNTKGRVIGVKMLRLTGYPDFDAPIEASLYKWRASGKKLKEIGRPFSLEITLLLHN